MFGCVLCVGLVEWFLVLFFFLCCWGFLVFLFVGFFGGWGVCEFSFGPKKAFLKQVGKLSSNLYWLNKVLRKGNKLKALGPKQFLAVFSSLI